MCDRLSVGKLCPRSSDLSGGVASVSRQTGKANVCPTFMIIGIVAVDRNGAIGKGGKLPWHYSADMKFFQRDDYGKRGSDGLQNLANFEEPATKPAEYCFEPAV